MWVMKKKKREHGVIFRPAGVNPKVNIQTGVQREIDRRGYEHDISLFP